MTAHCNDIVASQASITNYTNAVNKRPLCELDVYCQACLSLPVSNTIINKIFLVVSEVKIDSCNHMMLHVLDAVIRSRRYLTKRDKFCHFTVTHNML